MDPLSISASVAGLLALSASIISTGYACISRVKNNEGNVEALLNEIASFSGILAGLKARNSTDDASGPAPLHWLVKDHETVWQDSIRDCEKTLKEVIGIIDSLSSGNVVRLVAKGASMANKVERLMSKIERFKSFFVLCLQLQSDVDSKENSRVTNEILVVLQQLLHGQESLRKQLKDTEESKRREKIIHWLGPTSEAVHEDINRSRDANSSQWLLDRTEFLDWLTSEHSATFWLWGIQGSGKTVIVSKVIETIQTQCLEEGDFLVYHYCRFSDSATLLSERLIGAMIAMLCSKTTDSSSVPESLSKLFDRYRSPSYPSLNELQRPFHELCQYHARIFVIIDGLDEISDRSGILDFLNSLRSTSGIFKVFVASRPEVDLELAFESYLIVAVTESDVQLDIETYVQQRLEKLQIVNDEETDQYAIVSELVERAQGMFLWAVCQIDHLSRIRTAITTDVLTALPRGLESTFEGVLLRLEEEDQHLALQLLRVITFSQRPLDVSEVIEAAAVTPKIRSLKQLRKSTLRRPADLFQLCGSLIRQSHSTGKISLAHYSVQEFLSRPSLEKGRRNQFFLQEMVSQQAQLKACISYLCLEDFVSETFRETFRLAKDTRHTDSDLAVFAGTAFLDYAANYWTSHLKVLGSEGLDSVWPLLENFLFSECGGFGSWLPVAQYTHGDYKFPGGTEPIHVAVLYVLKPLIVELLRLDPQCLNIQTSDGRTPLHIALENNHEEILEFLIQQGASLKIADERGRTPLHVAIESGSEIAVTLLVTAGANVNVIQSDGGTPISVAVENRWDLLASFLSQMADPGVLLPDGRSLLHLAAQSGSLIWTTTLLESHAERLVDARDANGWTPLHYAVDQTHNKIVSKLISSKCLIKAFDESGWTPLHAAIRRRNLECASLILNAEWPGGRARARLPEIEATPSIANVAPLEVQSTSAESQDSRLDRWRRIPRRRMSGKYGLHSSQSRSPSRPDPSVFLLGEGSSQRHLFPRRPQRPPPLHLAVSDSYVEGAELLCKHPEKLEMDDGQKVDCLKTAIQLENTDLVLILVNIISKDRVKGLFTKLVSLPSEAVLEWVKKNFTVNEVYGDLIPSITVSNKESLVRILETWPDASESLLHRALMRCETSEHRNKLAMILVDNGIPASKVFMEQQKKPLLHSVIEAHDANFAKLLIEQGANVDVKNEQGETPLLVLASLDPLRQDQGSQQACLSLARFLVARAANATSLDQKGRSLCHRAAAAGNTKLLNWALHDLQLQSDLRDHHSRTPLLLAVEHGCQEAVRRLLDHTVSEEEGDDHMRPARVVSAMEYANLRSSPLLRAMIDRPERKITIVTFLVEADERAFANLSIDQQSNIADLRNSFYIEALCWAIDCNFETAFTYLLPKVSKSALFSHMTLDGDNVLHSAAGAVADDYLKTLLQRLTDHSDADNILEATNAHGKTPLDIVVSRGFLEKAAILLRSGAKPTPLQMNMVKESGNRELEALLLRYSSAT